MRALPLLLLLLALWPAPAAAHVVAPGADLRIAQTIAGAELTITVRGVSRTPAPAVVEIEAFHPVPDLPVELTMRSTETGRASRAAVRLAAGRAGPYRVSMQVFRAGPHELEVRTPPSGPCCRCASWCRRRRRGSWSSTAASTWPGSWWWAGC
ncbi:hypothetical protein ACFQ0B_60430 [Nonomuraea thailandensis]